MVTNAIALEQTGQGRCFSRIWGIWRHKDISTGFGYAMFGGADLVAWKWQKGLRRLSVAIRLDINLPFGNGKVGAALGAFRKHYIDKAAEDMGESMTATETLACLDSC